MKIERNGEQRDALLKNVACGDVFADEEDTLWLKTNFINMDNEYICVVDVVDGEHEYMSPQKLVQRVFAKLVVGGMDG